MRKLPMEEHLAPFCERGYHTQCATNSCNCPCHLEKKTKPAIARQVMARRKQNKRNNVRRRQTEAVGGYMAPAKIIHTSEPGPRECISCLHRRNEGCYNPTTKPSECIEGPPHHWAWVEKDED